MKRVVALDGLQTFIDDVARVVGCTDDEHEITRRVATLLSDLLAGGYRLPPAVMRPSPLRHMTYPLYIAPDDTWSMASVVWNVGQRTPVHSHETWGFVGIYSGAEHEIRYLKPAARTVGGLAREPLTTDQWRERMEAAVRPHARDGGDTDRWRRLAAEMQYIPSDFADAHAYRQLAQTLARLDEERGIQGNRLHYLAAPSGTYLTIARLLGRHREGRGWTRLERRRLIRPPRRGARQPSTADGVGDRVSTARAGPAGRVPGTRRPGASGLRGPA